MAERAVLLKARNLASRRGGRIVVAGIDLTVDRGGLYVLRGANGSGKTSLLRTLAGFSPPASGSLERTDGQATFLGHVDGLKAALTARENISFWRALYRSPSDAAGRAVERLGVSPFIDQRASSLSAGQKRRLALCRVALSGRALWLLDEPTAGMDAANIAAVINLIQDHCGEGGAAIVATHEPLGFETAVTITLNEAP